MAVPVKIFFGGAPGRQSQDIYKILKLTAKWYNPENPGSDNYKGRRPTKAASLNFF